MIGGRVPDVSKIKQGESLDITLRDYFAAHAMQGLLCGPSLSHSHKEYAAMCYKIADAMLEARK